MRTSEIHCLSSALTACYIKIFPSSCPEPPDTVIGLKIKPCKMCPCNVLYWHLELIGIMVVQRAFSTCIRPRHIKPKKRDCGWKKSGPPFTLPHPYAS